ncbi:hypothetical protein [Streptomyces coffeae]|uniref:hypothetical protein n=1 Tax=Streptomyces coffeae TaxID=621382 RepID=UPI001F24B2D0|nr:hypothetical protein [Streptomyces coffeae]
MHEPHHRGPSRSGTSRPLPTTIWLPDPDDPHHIPGPHGVLPSWAIDKIRTDFTRRSAPLIKISIRDTEPGMDVRTPCVTYTGATGSDSEANRKPVLLAELHPDTLPTPRDELTADGGGMPGAMENGWPGFFHRAHRLLSGDGLLLLATRQRRDAGRLTDPLGSLIASARTAGFRYLQHIVVVHGHPAGDRIDPTPPQGAPPGLIHSDLLILPAITSA